MSTKLLRLPSADDGLDPRDGEHADRFFCGPCGLDVSRTALTEIVYAWHECDCASVEFLHLVEHAWHRTCFIAEFKEVDE